MTKVHLSHDWLLDWLVAKLIKCIGSEEKIQRVKEKLIILYLSMWIKIRVYIKMSTVKMSTIKMSTFSKCQFDMSKGQLDMSKC